MKNSSLHKNLQSSPLLPKKKQPSLSGFLLSFIAYAATPTDVGRKGGSLHNRFIGVMSSLLSLSGPRWSASCSSLIQPETVVIRFCLVLKSEVYAVKNKGMRTHPYDAPVLLTIWLDTWAYSLKLWSVCQVVIHMQDVAKYCDIKLFFLFLHIYCMNLFVLKYKVVGKKILFYVCSNIWHYALPQYCVTSTLFTTHCFSALTWSFSDHSQGNDLLTIPELTKGNRYIP